MEKRAILVKQVDAFSNNQLIIQMFTIDDGLLKVPSRRDQDLVIKNDVLQAAEIVLRFVVINNHERDGRGHSEAGQGQAAGLRSLAKRTLDTGEGRYAHSWLLVRHFAPTAMMAGGAFRAGPVLTVIA